MVLVIRMRKVAVVLLDHPLGWIEIEGSRGIAAKTQFGLTLPAVHPPFRSRRNGVSESLRFCLLSVSL